MANAPAVTRISGVVEVVNRQGTGLKLKGGEWHNYSLPQYRTDVWEDPAPGDMVIITEVESNGRSYVNSIVIDVPAAAPVAAPQGVSEDNRPIVTRLACLNAAVRLYAACPNSADTWQAAADVETLASRLVGWVYGSGVDA